MGLKLKKGNKLVGSWKNIQAHISKESKKRSHKQAKAINSKITDKPVYIPPGEIK